MNDFQSARPLKYSLIRDLAVFELRHPLHGYHSIPFSLNDLELGRQVDIYAYPKEGDKSQLGLNRRLLRFHGEYKGQTTAGLLAFEYGNFDGKEIRGGSSGGLVVDSETKQVVDVLSRAGIDKSGKLAALAVPIQSLVDFVGEVQPWLVQNIFPSAKKKQYLAGLGGRFSEVRLAAFYVTTASIRGTPRDQGVAGEGSKFSR